MNDTLLLLGFATTPLELISFVLALITVALNIRQNHWAWLFAIISSAAYGFVFFESRLYGDMGCSCCLSPYQLGLVSVAASDKRRAGLARDLAHAARLAGQRRAPG